MSDEYLDIPDFLRAPQHEGPVQTTEIAVVAAIDNKQLRGRVRCGPSPGQFYAEVDAGELARWREKGAAEATESP